MKHTTKNEVKEKIKRLSNALVGYKKSLNDLCYLLDHANDKPIKEHLPLDNMPIYISLIRKSVTGQQKRISQIIEELTNNKQ